MKSQTKGHTEHDVVQFTTVLPGEELRLSATDMGDASKVPFLNVYNPGELAGSYKVEVTE